jgi:DNA replication protein DnaC
MVMMKMRMPRTDSEDPRQSIADLADYCKLEAFRNYRDHIHLGQSLEQNLLSILTAQAQLFSKNSEERRIKLAGFPSRKTIDTFVFDKATYPKLNWQTVQELLTCEFIELKQDIVAVSKHGCGKTHISIAIGISAIQKGYSVIFKSSSQLAREIIEAKNKKNLSAYYKRLKAAKLLIIDEVGLPPLTEEESRHFFEVVTGRYEVASTIFTTNLEFSKWNQALPSDEIVHAVVDRIVHHSHFLDMSRKEGYRSQNALSKIKK